MDQTGIKDLKDPLVCPERVKTVGMVLLANLGCPVTLEDPVPLGFRELTESVIHPPAWERLLLPEGSPKSHKAAFKKKWGNGNLDI
ncbi:UNVERIFIED_CONTAM: hypothetical protein K2H54_070094 [Gekko kuhli]